MVLVILEITGNRMQTINQTNSNIADIAFNLCLFWHYFFCLNEWIHPPRTHDGYFQNSIRPKLFLSFRKNINDVTHFRDFGNHWQGTHSAKMCADSLAENTPNTPKFIQPICPICKKVQDIFEKKSFIGRPQSVNGYEKCAMRSS